MSLSLRIFTEPQFGASYEDQLTHAREAEALGFDAWFRSDHYLTMDAGPGLPGPTDAWVTLAGLARETERIRLGTMVTAATFRLPGPLAIAVAQVDAMSGGRVELGLGAGWFGAEHTAYGIPFPSVAERFDRLEEQLAIVTGLWEVPLGDRFSYEGAHWHVADSPGLPKPVQRPRPPVIVGGYGKTRTPELAARYADELNLDAMPPDDLREALPVIAQRCEEIGRDPSSLDISVHLWRKDEERNRREPLDELVSAYAELGVSRLIALLPGIEHSDEPLDEYLEAGRMSERAAVPA